jgi:amino-acid N-acetyltransferase
MAIPLTEVAILPLRAGDPTYPGFLAALEAAGLPTDDLDGGGRFFAAAVDGRPVAFGGLEGAGPDQLLRSVVVPAGLRGGGHGRRLAEALTRQAGLDGAERLWLLTTSADPFFARLGWQATDRASAPEVIRASRQFSELCPASAVLMRRPLTRIDGPTGPEGYWGSSVS